MHYPAKGYLVKSENAAKPICQPCEYLLKYILSLPRHFKALDYGCGKFRYTIPLSKRVQQVYAVDSTFQIKRTQIINGKRTNLCSYADKYLKNVEVFDCNSNHWSSKKYDFVLCSNVLSAIPILNIRIEVLKKLREILKTNGQILVTTQYRNSYFKDYCKNPNAIKYKDGWLIKKNTKEASFYGMINLENLKKICTKAKLHITQAFIKGQSAYVCGIAL